MADLYQTNRTWLCSVAFLDIVEYSSQSVELQIKWKKRFNGYLQEALQNVAESERVVIDTGDGAAVCFLGAPEEAMFTALEIWHYLLLDEREHKPQLKVRIGINLGPIKLVRDINGAPNALGDGMNACQRIMSFAPENQILVSQSYFEVVSRLSDDYKTLFTLKGVRTDKHVREHTVYKLSPPNIDESGEYSSQWPVPALPSIQGSSALAAATHRSSPPRTRSLRVSLPPPPAPVAVPPPPPAVALPQTKSHGARKAMPRIAAGLIGAGLIGGSVWFFTGRNSSQPRTEINSAAISNSAPEPAREQKVGAPSGANDKPAQAHAIPVISNHPAAIAGKPATPAPKPHRPVVKEATRLAPQVVTTQPAPAAAPTPAEPAPPVRIAVGGAAQMAKLVHKVLPVYPLFAKSARISGVVRLMALIGKDGTVQDVEIVQGNPLLAKAAKDAVQQWVYQPTLIEGRPVEVSAPIDVNFMLDR